MTEVHQSDAFHGLVYRGCRQSVDRLVTTRPAETGLPVPACPGWSVRDLVAHLLQVCRMVVTDDPGEISEPPPPEPDTPVADLLSAWAELDEPLTRVLPSVPWLRRRILLLDVLSHELDIRRALGVPVSEGHLALPDALELATMGFTLSVNGHGLPALRIETPDRHWVAGEGEPAVTVRGPAMDMFRSLTGRRTVRQIGELSWSAPPEVWLPAFTWGPFVPPARPVEEAATTRAERGNRPGT